MLKVVLRVALFVCLALIATGLAIPRVYAAPIFIPAAGRVDMVHDAARHILYITSGDSVLRYDLAAGAFLPPFQLGGHLKGIDLSPDGNTLLVCDQSATGDDSTFPATGNTWVDVVDLRTGTSRKGLFPRASGESGTYAVAFGTDGRALVSSSFSGSGWVPLRRYDPATDTAVTVASTVRQDTMVSASADGSVIGFAESNASDGPFGLYKVSDGSLTRSGIGGTPGLMGTNWFNYEIGVSRDGTQLAIPTYGGTFFYDSHLIQTGHTIGTYAGAQPVGLVYSPVANLVYFPFAQTSEVRVFDTTTGTQTAAIDFGQTFTSFNNQAYYDGRMKISRDGSLLFATVEGGVSYIELNTPFADSQALQTLVNTPLNVTLTGSIGDGSTLTYQLINSPQHGTLAGTLPNLTYTPAPDFEGTDSFTFMTLAGQQQSAAATVSIQVKRAPRMYLLWTNTNGQAAVWNLSDANPSATAALYGPYPGWTAKAIAQGPDGHGRLLWTSTDGRAALWNLTDASPAATAAVYGPFPGWITMALTVGPDNAAHLLWDNNDGRVALWNTTDAAPAATCIVAGPYTGWTGIAIGIGSNNQERLLWNNVSGQAAVWNLADADPAADCAVYGFFSGWTAKTLNVAPDNTVRLLWNSRGGRLAVFNLNDAYPTSSALFYGPYAGWAGQDLSVGADNKGHLLWDNVSGQMSLWNLSDASPAATCVLAGPYSGWTAVSIAAKQ